MKLSCIATPKSSRYIQTHEWQIRFCQGNHCAALLLSFFSHWHDWKLKNDKFYFKVNNIAEAHGEGRPHSQNAYLFFTNEELIEGTLGFYGKNAINEALQFLVKLNVLSIRKNPNPKQRYDKTKHFSFYPDVCNEWIAKNCSSPKQSSKKSRSAIDVVDLPKAENAFIKKEQLSIEKGKAITNTTYHTTNNHSFIDEPDFDSSLLDEVEQNDNASVQPATKTQEIIHALVEKGMPHERFQYDDVVPIIEDLVQEGATVTHFAKAYDLSVNMTKGGHFGIRYLQKVVNHLLKQVRRQPVLYHSPNDHAESKTDLSRGMHWLADLANDDEGEK